MASSGILGLSRPLTGYRNLMNIDGIGMSLIPGCSLHQAQKPAETRIGIRPAVVEKSAIQQNSICLNIMTLCIGSYKGYSTAHLAYGLWYSLCRVTV